MYYIKKSVVDEICNTIGKSPIESGGIIGIQDNIICSYFFDKDSCSLYDKYIPNVITLNKVIQDWSKISIDFIGIVHSHANGYNRPSQTDSDYARKIMQTNNSLKNILFPIVTIENNVIKISYYRFAKSFRLIKIKVI